MRSKLHTASKQPRSRHISVETSGTTRVLFMERLRASERAAPAKAIRTAQLRVSSSREAITRRCDAVSFRAKKSISHATSDRYSRGCDTSAAESRVYGCAQTSLPRARDSVTRVTLLELRCRLKRRG